MKVGDMILCRRKFTGIIIAEDGTWAQILWCHNGRMTWEDMECSFEGGVFEVVSETTRPICPKPGHLVTPRQNFKGAGTGEGLVVDARGIDVMVMQLEDGAMIWQRRDELEVISESR